MFDVWKYIISKFSQFDITLLSGRTGPLGVQAGTRRDANFSYPVGPGSERKSVERAGPGQIYAVQKSVEWKRTIY